MTEKLNWKVTNDRDKMVGFYRGYPLYQIELTTNDNPQTFNQMLRGRVVAYSHPHWAKLCENSGFSPTGVQVSGPDSDLPLAQVNSEFRVVSELHDDVEKTWRFMEEFQALADIDFSYRCNHIDVTATND